MGRKTYVIHAPGGLGYFLVKNTDNNRSSHSWYHSSYGLQRARKFYSVDNARAVLRQGFWEAGGHPAYIVEVKVRMSYYVTTQGGHKVYWLCPDTSYPNYPRWQANPGAKYSVWWFSDQQAALAMTARARLPEGGGTVKIVRAPETYLAGW